MGFEAMTPWQKILHRFAVNQSEMARLLNCHRTVISRACTQGGGLVHAKYQRRIMLLARERQIALEPTDLLPEL